MLTPDFVLVLQNVTKGARHKIVISIQKLKERQNLLKSLERVSNHNHLCISFFKKPGISSGVKPSLVNVLLGPFAEKSVLVLAASE